MPIRRDSRGRFSSTGGGGVSRRSEQQANNRRTIRATEVYNQSGPARRNRSAAKQAKGSEVAVKATRVYAKRNAVLASTAGAKLGGQNKVIKPDPWRRSLNVGKAADNRAGGGASGTIAGVKAIGQLKGQARINIAAKRAGLGRRKRS